ncbi:hypothetical protein R3Q06_16715 [Rhodococcus erythropolis]|nr:hypothetical protein [Rhodococcus erythropolis]
MEVGDIPADQHEERTLDQPDERIAVQEHADEYADLAVGDKRIRPPTRDLGQKTEEHDHRDRDSDDHGVDDTGDMVVNARIAEAQQSHRDDNRRHGTDDQQSDG